MPNPIPKHLLNTKWIFYYHDPENSDWSLESYVKVAEIRSVEEFWSLYNMLPKQSFHLGMFFLMRNDILPTWEDSENINGGCWSYKISVSDVYPMWEILSARVVCDSITTTNDENVINGISISPKKGFCVLKIWNRSAAVSNVSLLKNDIPKLKHTESLYVAFRDK
jgi:translation initiation factor 4E